jgi:hypothetical protein
MRTLTMIALLFSLSACAADDGGWNQTINQWCGSVMSCGGGEG